MGPPLQIMQANIQKTIFFLLFGLFSTGLFSHNSYAGQLCEVDATCNDENTDTFDFCVMGQCQYSYTSTKALISCDATTVAGDDYCATKFDNDCARFECSSVGTCTIKQIVKSSNAACTTSSCGTALCTSRGFCGVDFDTAANPLYSINFVPENTACNDGDNNACTAGACSKIGLASKTNMVCKSTAKDCSDGNLCTPDLCNTTTGVCVNPQKDCSAMIDQCNDGVCSSSTGACIKQPKSGLCSDGSVCTLNDFCSNGLCKSGDPKDCNDGKPCTDDTCNMVIGCLHTNDDSNVCPGDGNVCNGNEKCSNGQCVGGIQLNCDDKDPCTIDSCGATGCVHEPVTCDPKADECSGLDYLTYGPGTCSADPTDNAKYVCNYPKSAKNCNDSNVCTDDSCNGVTGCHNDPNSITCDDGKFCNGIKECKSGSCVLSIPVPDCNDGIACTGDGCSETAKACIHTPHDNACSDDTNPCTDKKCDVKLGCQYPNDNTNACSDSNACTTPDKCTDGSCTSSPKNCDDGVACTTDSCDATTGACVTTPDNSQCKEADGLACTEPVCDTANGCNELLKDDFCVINNICYADGDKNPANPCQACISSNEPSDWSFIADGTSCDDGNACTAPDVCTAGQCQSGAALDCNDGNDCTNDECGPSVGCSHPFNDNACSDGDACTTPDVCTSGSCAAGAPKDCKDANPCTIDNCDTATGACTNAANATFTCTDPANPWCDVGVETEPVCQYLQPTCHVISCEDLIISASKDPMPRYAVLYSNDPNYFSNLNAADEAALKDKICNNNGIGNVDLTTTYAPTFHCVVSQPQPLPAQQFNNNQTAVDGDLKQEAAAPAGDPLHYYMSFQYPDGVKNKTGVGDVVCTVELADIAQTSLACSAPFAVNACAEDADCDDSDPCTTDSCKADGTCEHAYVVCAQTKPSECVDGSYKTYIGGTCTPDENDDPQCVYKEGVDNCDDGNDCTDDLCSASGCFSQPNSNVCDDGNACTTGDVCKDGSCSAGAATDCNDDDACTTDVCLPSFGCQSESINCLDDDKCTTDSCDPVTGCSNVAVSCVPDSNVCTTEQCDTATGKCTSVSSGEAGCCISNLDCEDNNGCTTDSCNTATGACSYVDVAENTACDDGDACTIGDVCVTDGNCASGADASNCNDNNVCTTDSCDPSTGCTNVDVANGTACGDGNACDGDEVCESGTCVAGTDVNCDDDNRCTDDQCNILNGECLHQLATNVECSGPPEWCDINAIEKVDQCTYKEPVCQVILCDDVIAKNEVKVPADMPAFFLLYSNNPDEFIDAAALADMKQKLCAGGQVVPVNLANMIVPTLTCDAVNTEGNVVASFTKDPQNIQDGDLNHFAGKEFPHSYQSQVPGSMMEKTGTGSIQCGVSLDFGNPAFTKNAQCSADFQIADCSSAADCDDGNPCTDDSCSASGSCIHINNATTCDDGNSCTIDDVCDEGKCEPGVQKDCNDNSACTSDACDQVTGSCVNKPNSNSNCCSADAACEDGNNCTNDTCDLVTGKCSSVNVANWPGQACDDLNACTVEDFCTDGKCVAKDKDCSDGNNCTDDTCNPAVGCTNTNNTNACDDANACTKDDVCKDGSCQAGGSLACDDKDDCTDDSCDATTGACVYSPNKACVCKVDADCGDKDPCTQNSCDPATHKCVVASVPGCCITDHDCPEVGPCQNKTCVNNVCGAESIDNCCEADADCAEDGDKCTDEFCDQDAHVCISQGECEEFCPDGFSKPKTCYLVDHHLTAKPGEACLTCQDDAGNVILSWKNGGNICPPVLDVSQTPNGDVVVTFVPDHIFKFNTGVGDMKKLFFEPPLGLLQDIDLFEITAADGTTSNHAYVTTAAGGLYKGDLTSGNIVSVANTKKSGEDLQALAPYFLATNADGKQIFLGHTLGIKQLTLDENYQFVALGDKFTKEKGDGGDPHGFELYNGLLFYGLMSYTQIFDSTNFANNFKVSDVYYSIKLSHDKMFTVNIAPEGQPGHDYGQFSFAPINAAVPPLPWADVIKAALGVVGEALVIPVQPVPNIAKMESGVALGQLTEVCGGTWDLAIPLDEICDGIDNDLDGLVDEDADGNPMTEPMEAVLPVLCEKNQMICEKGKWLPDPGNYQPVDEICNNGFDDDCDGMVDEDCEGCTIGDTHPCGIKIGECEPGHTECIAGEAGVGVWTGVCEGGTGPVDEICGDNLDNDCDERIDENCCESKCCTTCCCCGTTYAPLPVPPSIPTPPEKEAEVEPTGEPEVAAEAKEEPKPEIIAEDVTEDECIAKGGSFEVVKAADGKPTFKLNKDGTMELFGICWEATGSGCSLNPSAVPTGFNLLWLLGVVPIFIIRLKTR